MTKKKIAIFIHHLARGGAEKITLNLANGLIEAGYDVDLVTYKCRDTSIKELSEFAETQLQPEVRIIHLSTSRLITSIIPLIQYLRKQRPDVLLSALNFLNLGAIIAKIFSFTKIPVYVVNHVYYSEYLKSNPGFKTKVIHYMMKLLYPIADQVISVSKGSAIDLSILLNMDPLKIVVAYNPVISSDFIEKSHVEVEHPFFNNQDNAPVVISAGRFEHPKDFITLIDAIKIVNSTKKVYLLIFGQGPERNKLLNYIKENEMEFLVDMPGHTNKILAFMRRSNAFILSSYFEALPTVIIESLAVNCPVISSNCPTGPSEILENGKYGKLVSIADSNALAIAILETLNSKPSDVQKEYLEQFTVPGATKRYLEIFFN